MEVRKKLPWRVALVLKYTFNIFFIKTVRYTSSVKNKKNFIVCNLMSSEIVLNSLSLFLFFFLNIDQVSLDHFLNFDQINIYACLNGTVIMHGALYYTLTKSQ